MPNSEKLLKLQKQQSQTIAQLAKAIKKRDGELAKNGEAMTKTGELVDSLGKTVGEIQKTFNDELEKSGGLFLGQQAERAKSAGEQFTDSDLFANSSSSEAVQKGVSVGVKSFHKKAMTEDNTVAVAGNGGVPLQPFRPDKWLEDPEQQFTIRDLLPTQAISSNAYEYVRVTEFDIGADYRPETTASTESSLTFDLMGGRIETISHWMPASKEVLDDVSRMRNFIDHKLVYGIKVKEETELLYGAGGSGALTGLMVDADIPTFARAATTDTNIDILRRSMTDLRNKNFAATGFIINPIDFESIELAKGTDGHYIWLSIPTGTGQTIFRVPIVDTAAMAKGSFLTGAFQQGCTLYDRMNSSVQFSDSHEDYFTRQMIAILAEERIGLAVEQPHAFTKGTLK